MKTLSQYIKETYLSRFGHTQVFKNPSRSDVLSLRKEKVQELRFLANSRKKDVYVWDAYHAIHFDVFNHLKKNSIIAPGMRDYVHPALYPGYAQIEGDTIYYYEDEIETSDLAINYDDIDKINDPIRLRERIEENEDQEKTFAFVEKYIRGFNQGNVFRKMVEYIENRLGDLEED